ncbi:TauD/TfdA family dioxygenase [Thermomonospora cellulosilytica]|uniref:Alpha-ketoglutarate-dependent taurine dioxygenase n=1 Tax=Thermomonospora cellulosilytica TaxID=1411118 RepID=A0A7W3N0Q4_9ACTN|nr:TauD/TfdA family dioxygenase [Thermomonospora cellulosilytica]MBA9005391.1 alpha-ketoglutarate-dependent taurine dioxygenase [Thermomonospora cellulosilytica]
MMETVALSPHPGAEVRGLRPEDLLDDAVVARCLEALKWRGVPLVHGLHLDDEAQPAFSRRLDELQDWATRERFRYAHDWTVGDVVIWDNTGMPHRALPYEETSERTLHRTTVKGGEAWS